jgi:hypothetical protein
MLKELVSVSLQGSIPEFAWIYSGEIKNLLLKLIIIGNDNIIPDTSNINYINSQCSHTLY